MNRITGLLVVLAVFVLSSGYGAPCRADTVPTVDVNTVFNLRTLPDVSGTGGVYYRPGSNELHIVLAPTMLTLPGSVLTDFFDGLIEASVHVDASGQVTSGDVLATLDAGGGSEVWFNSQHLLGFGAIADSEGSKFALIFRQDALPVGSLAPGALPVGALFSMNVVAAPPSQNPEGFASANADVAAMVPLPSAAVGGAALLSGMAVCGVIRRRKAQA